MSLRIDIDNIIAVLLSDGWHDVASDSTFESTESAPYRSSFDLDSYEFGEYSTIEKTLSTKFRCIHGGGANGIGATGFSFYEADETEDYRKIRVSGPLSAIIAVRERRS